MTTGTQEKTETKEIAKKPSTLKEMLAKVQVKSRFEEILGKRAPAFISSIISAAGGNATLAKAEPESIIAAAAMAASLDLPINGALGSAALVPYRTKDGAYVATFQIMRTGWVQLAQRSGQYASLHAGHVYDGQLVDRNDITGEVKFDQDGKKSDKVIGFVAHFRLLNGFEKYLYMSVEECHAHGKRYSKSYGSETGLWKTNPDAMCLKTVLKRLISKWGPVSIDSPLAKAVEADQAKITPDGKPEYIDSTIVKEGEEAPTTYKTPPMTKPGETTAAVAKETPDGEIILNVLRVAETTLDGKTVTVIVVGPEPGVKYYTDLATVTAMAKKAKETGQSLATDWADRTLGDSTVRWITTIRVYDGK